MRALIKELDIYSFASTSYPLVGSLWGLHVFGLVEPLVQVSLTLKDSRLSSSSYVCRRQVLAHVWRPTSHHICALLALTTRSCPSLISVNLVAFYRCGCECGSTHGPLGFYLSCRFLWFVSPVLVSLSLHATLGYGDAVVLCGGRCGSRVAVASLRSMTFVTWYGSLSLPY